LSTVLFVDPLCELLNVGRNREQRDLHVMTDIIKLSIIALDFKEKKGS